MPYPQNEVYVISNLSGRGIWETHHINSGLICALCRWFSKQEEKYYQQIERKSVWEYGDWKQTCEMQIYNPAWDVTRMNADVNPKSSRQDFMVIVNT